MIRKNAHLTQEEFARSIGATRSMIAQYEGGHVIPDASKVQLICMKYNIREEWLREGSGEARAADMVQSLNRVLKQYPAINELAASCLERFGAEDWKQLNSLLEKAFYRQALPKEDEPNVRHT